MNRSHLACVAAVTLAFVATARAESNLEFEKVTSEAGKFTADLPGTPKESTEKFGGDMVYHKMAVRRGLMEFTVAYFDLADKPRFREDPRGAMKAFRGGARGTAEILDEREITLGDVPGIEYRVVPVGAINVRERMFLDGLRFYRVIMVGTLDDVTSKEADRFFESFKIVK